MALHKIRQKFSRRPAKYQAHFLVVLQATLWGKYVTLLHRHPNIGRICPAEMFLQQLNTTQQSSGWVVNEKNDAVLLVCSLLSAQLDDASRADLLIVDFVVLCTLLLVHQSPSYAQDVLSRPPSVASKIADMAYHLADAYRQLVFWTDQVDTAYRSATSVNFVLGAQTQSTKTIWSDCFVACAKLSTPVEVEGLLPDAGAT